MTLADTNRRRTALCVVALALLPFGLFWRVALFQGVFADGDLYDYNYPLLRTIARQWKAAEVPLWNPYIFGGTPLHGNMQGGVFYPPNLILLVGPEWKSYQYSILLHYSLAGVFTFLYLRALSLTATAAAFGAIVFMLGGFAMGSLGHVTLLRTVPWLPLILFAVEGWRRTLHRRYVALAGLGLGLMLLAGHPQIPLYAIMVSGAYAGYFLRFGPSERRGRLAAGYVVSLLLGTGLAAVQLLPTLQLAMREYLRPSDRSYEYFVNFSFSPILLANLVLPRIVPSDESELAIYVGISTLVLALIGAWRYPSDGRAHRTFFVALAAVALLLAFGKWTLLSVVLFRLPLYNVFTAPARNLFEFTFAVAVLAAMGVQAIQNAEAEPRVRRRAVLAFVVLVCLATIAMAWLRESGVLLETDLRAVNDQAWVLSAALGRLPIVVASLAVLWFFPARQPWRRLLSRGLLALLVLDLFSYTGSIYSLHPPAVYTARPPVVDFLKAKPALGRIFTLEQPPDDGEQDKAMLSPDGNASHEVESINGFDSMMLRQVDAASGHVMPSYGLVAGPGTYEEPQFQRFMDLLNTRYVLTPAARHLNLPTPRYQPTYEDDRVRVFENTQALPRVFLVPVARLVTREKALEVLASGFFEGVRFDPRKVALLEPPEDDAGSPARFGSRRLVEDTTPMSAEVVIADHGAGQLRVAVTSSAPGLLVHATNYSRGWKAWVDGRPVELYRVDGLLQGVPLPEGRHEVLFKYRPGAFVLGASLSLLSGLLVAAGLLSRGFTSS